MTRSVLRDPGQLAAPGTPTGRTAPARLPGRARRGRRLLAEPGDKVPLKLVDSAAFETGVLKLTYAGACFPGSSRLRPVMRPLVDRTSHTMVRRRPAALRRRHRQLPRLATVVTLVCGW